MSENSVKIGHISQIIGAVIDVKLILNTYLLLLRHTFLPFRIRGPCV